jgi:glycosyltransferase involved in cell wall biosynthesis
MTTPTISVVIASGASGDFLFRCLDSLREQASEQGADIIVADRCGGATLTRLKRDYPFVTVLQADLDHRPSVPELRKLGATQAQGDIVAIIEEHCVAPPHWIKTIRYSLQPDDAAIGGPILDNNYERVRDWVVYFSEYHNFLPPWPDGERYLLNGANIAYQRQKLLKYQNVLDSGYWEVVLHPRLINEGAFRSIPDMGVYHTGPFDYGYYLEQRYLLSRVWGGTQREKVSFGRRLAYLVAAPLFPFLLLARIAQRVFNSGGHLIKRFLVALPPLVPVVLAYVWGEWQGYLLGVGDALERVE